MLDMKKKVIKWTIFFVLLAAVILLFSLQKTSVEMPYQDEGPMQEEMGESLVDLSEIRGGGPPKGGIGIDRGIPALAENNIKFVTVEKADKWIEDNELVLAIIYKNITRVYPLQILVWHEIANDVIAGDPILITYCPLCGSGIAYERTLAGEPVEFGTSGKLFSSNLVMYDRATDTYWSQIDGKAILGELTGAELKAVSLDTVEWKDWKAVHPNSEVLSQNTGFSRNYGRDPYANYFADDFLFFQDPQNIDNTGRISNKEYVFGVEIDGAYKAYRKVDVETQGVIEDTFNGVNLRVEQQDDGRVIITNTDTGEEIIKEVDFWFAWYAFHPTSEIYGFE